MSKMKAKKRLSLIVWDVPPELRKQFKGACVRKGVTMKKVIMDYMAKYAGVVA